MPRKMKDSGIEWIGEIPEGWNTGKCKTILVANDGGVWGDDPVGDGTDKTVIRSTEQTIDGKWCIENPAKRDLSRVEYRKARIEENDLLITKSSGSDLHIGKTTIADTYFRDNECYYSNFIQRIRCADYSPKLLWYLFNSPIIREQCVFLQNTTSGIGNINANIIQNLLIPIPPLSTQHRITSYLDTQCAKIDAVLEQTRQSIEEYKRLKQAVITRAVTKGIRPGRKMKDSGIEWIGDIPFNWSRDKVFRIFQTIGSGTTPKSDNPDYYDGDIHWIQSGDINGGFLTDTKVSVTDEAINTFSALKIYDAPFIIMAMYGGSIGNLSISHIDGCVNQACCVMQNGKQDIRYSFYALKVAKDYLVWKAVGGGQPNISQDTIKQLWLPMPPTEEQVEIADYLDDKITEMDALIAKKEQLLSYVENYKKSLIFEYVTGKKEVASS